MMDLDAIVGKLGEYGRFQILIYIFCCVQGVGFLLWDMLTVTSFLGPTSDFQCIVKEENPDGSWSNNTYNNSVNSGACEEGELIFDLETYGRTMVTEWELVGDRAMLVELSQSLYMGAMMVGSLVSGPISDRFGRKPCFAVSAALTAFFGIATGLAPNIWVFVATRILSGFFSPWCGNTAFVLSMEVFPPKSRAAAGIITGCFTALAYLPLAALAYFIRDWRNLQLTASALRCLLLPLLVFMPESLQWLAVKGRYDELEKLLQRIARFNGIDIAFPILPPVATDDSEKTTADEQGQTEELLVKGKEKSMDELFMYDSALSLDRDYIPPEDGFSLKAYSSESETEDVPETVSTSYSMKRDPQRYCKIPPANSSISILSELQREQGNLSRSIDSLGDVISTSISSVVPTVVVPMNKPLRKKSVSLCLLPNIQAPRKISEISQYQQINELDRTISFPNLSVNPKPAKNIHHRTAAAKPSSRRLDNITIPSQDHFGSLFLLSAAPSLAVPFGISQTLSMAAGAQHVQSISTLEEVISGSEVNSGSESSPPSGYETLEEGYFTEHSQSDGYKELPVFSESEGKLEEKKEKSYNWLDLFRKSSVRQICLASMCMWCSTYVVYVGLSMNSDGLAGDPYINFTLVGLVEIPAVVIAVLSAVRIGRRVPIGVLQILSVLSCCMYLVLPTVDGSVVTAVLSVVALLLAKTFISAAYYITCLLTAEILPTSLRSTGLGFYVLCARLGGAVAPIILISDEVWSRLPIMIFCVMNLASCMALLPLPEMINMPQPLTPDDIKKIRRVSRERKFGRAPPPPEAFV